MRLLSPEAAGRLVGDANPRTTLNLITFESTCDVLAELAGRKIPRHRTEEKRWFEPEAGDQVLVVRLRPDLDRVARQDATPDDFLFWLYLVESVDV